MHRGVHRTPAPLPYDFIAAVWFKLNLQRLNGTSRTPSPTNFIITFYCRLKFAISHGASGTSRPTTLAVYFYMCRRHTLMPFSNTSFVQSTYIIRRQAYIICEATSFRRSRLTSPTTHQFIIYQIFHSAFCILHSAFFSLFPFPLSLIMTRRQNKFE